MTLPRIFIIGASGHGLVVLEAAVAQGYEVVGWLDSARELGSEILGFKVLGKPLDLPRLMTLHKVDAGILAISNNRIRHTVANSLVGQVPGFRFVTVIHPTAWVSPSARLGDGVFVNTGAVINALCRVGDHAIVNTQASLDHESELESFACLLPGVTTGGGVRVGRFTCICAGATLSHRVTIGDDTLVGAGALVLEDLPRLVLAAGVPARVIRARLPDERHF